MRVAVCSRSFSRNETLRRKIKERYVDVKFNDQGIVFDSHSLVTFLSGYDAAIIGLEKINSDVLSQLPRLNVIGKYGVGLDKIDLKACNYFGVRIGWKPGVNATAVAELTLSMALTIVRGSAWSNVLVKDGLWRQVIGKQLSSLTVGVIGCGNVGSAFVKLLSGFKCPIFVFDKEDRTDICSVQKAKQVTFSFLIKNSDVISIHLPDDTSTRSLFSKNFYHDVKLGSYLINTARGSLLSDKLILQGLNSGRFAGVALDVLEVEPPVSSELVHHQNCFITSHIGGSSEEAVLAMGMAAIEGLEKNSAACDLASGEFSA